ncbi:MAG: flagellar hook-associated protein FlgL [Vampirovibrionales bacterium]|nr:flagellar hook-associated protein FlgL [Vampirovibrionales bacterium]
MVLGRVSNSILSNRAVRYLQNNLGQLGQLQGLVASGKNISKPSDDPVGLTRVLSLNNTLKADARYTRNIEAAQAELKTVDTTMLAINNLVQRAEEIATQGASAIYSQAQRDTLAQEVSNLMDTLTQLGNTKLGNQYLFAGFKTNAAPFSRGTGDAVTYAGTPPTEDTNREIEVAEGFSITVNINGQTLLGNSVAGTPPTGNGLFKTLAVLKHHLQAGDVPNIRAQIDILGTDLDAIKVSHANVGALLNRLDDMVGRNEQRNATLSGQLAEIQDVDMAKVLSDLQYQQSVLQGSMSVAGRVLQTSLIDFLR